MIPWPGIRSRAGHLIFSWVHCLLDSLNLTHSSSSFLYTPWLDILFYSNFAHRSQKLLLFALLFVKHSISTCSEHTHTILSLSLTLSLTKKSWRRCQECVCCPFDTDSDAILGPWGGQSHGTWHSTTPLQAWLVFLSWHCPGYPGRELVQLLLIPSLCIRTP